MEKKINYLVVFLVIMTVGLALLSFFIAFKLREDKPRPGVAKTKASSVTYRKVVKVEKAEQIESQQSFLQQPSPTLQPPDQPEVLSPSPSIESMELVISPTTTSKATQKPVTNLPQSGLESFTFLIFIIASGLILFSFII